MSLLGWTLIYPNAVWTDMLVRGGTLDTQRKDHERTQGDGGHLQGERSYKKLNLLTS